MGQTDKFHFLQSPPYRIHDINTKPWFHKQKYTGCRSWSKTTDWKSAAQPNLTSAAGNNGVVLKTAEKLGTTNPAAGGGERPPGGRGRHPGPSLPRPGSSLPPPAPPPPDYWKVPRSGRDWRSRDQWRLTSVSCHKK